VQQTGARHLIILGDFLHARASLSPGVVDALAMWRERCAEVAVTLVAGNHDQYAGPPPDYLDIAWCEESALGPFRLLHIPPDAHAPDETIALCGHLHPYAVIAGKTREAVRLPCFHLGPRQLVLPAFGRFTGGHTVSRRPGERIFVIAGETVIEPHARRKSHDEWLTAR
jgi:DNA ligase-associated metallophosphoesterase